VRLYAKERSGERMHSVLSDEEIAIRSGLELENIMWISRQVAWDKITVGDAKKFCMGCNFDPFDYKDRNRLSAYTRRGTYAFLRNSSQWHTTFQPLIKILQNAQKT
tara:strand:- start:448 stop:765 length:318 start_codon:yes stop_codon:yes gene_type:complete